MSRLEDAAIAAWHEECAARKSSRGSGGDFEQGVHDPIVARRVQAMIGDLTSTIDPALKKRLKEKIMAARKAYQANAKAKLKANAKVRARAKAKA